ncbi:MAG: DnaJ C-terminal domain-containing protein [Dissulfurimicrobium sp.]|uniref:DnaJ C-terminal domain-containing protein n=1 Tax=Dissulfurimicrobium sp. TaxID=2022436 RepID=UPI00404970D0
MAKVINYRQDMTSAEDPWKLLGLTPGVSREEIKQAYRRLARLCHPDTARSSLYDREAFLRLKTAYEQLIDSHAWGAEGSIKIADRPDGEQIEDGVFFFLSVTAREAFYGVTKNITVMDRETMCPKCGGSGRAHVDERAVDADISICDDCGGTGRKALVWGNENLFVVCATCSGTGYTGQPLCPLCRGKGRIVISRDIAVCLPRGIRSGEILRLPGKGPWRTDKNARDPAFVEIKVEFPEGWRLNGLDIYATVNIDIWTALSGGRVSISSFDGAVPLDIPPGLSQGETIAIANRGWINEAGERGRLLLAMNLILPRRRPPKEAIAFVNLLKEVWPVDNSPLPVLPHK